MIKSLQKRFILTSMTAITILLAVLLGALNCFNFFITHGESERMLERCFTDASRKDGAPPPFLPQNNEKPHFFNAPITEDNALSARFFSVKLDGDGNVIFTDVDRISSVTADEAKLYANTVIAKNKAAGRFKSFLYRVDTQNSETTAFFLDISRENRNMTNVLVISLLIGLICWAVMLLIVILLSKAAIRHIAENIEKQKQFVTNAGHELKTPLAIILSNTEALELTCADGGSKYTRNIKQQTLRLGELMQNLLILSRADESGFRLAVSKENISDIVSHTAEHFMESAAQKAVLIETNIESGISADVNRDTFSQLVSILLDNAVKYSASESEITVSLFRNGKNAVLSTENECENLPECKPEQLFERFYRGDSAHNQKSGGSGIGLSAAKAIAEAHGGKISVEYKNGSKIIFTASLPIKHEERKGKH